MNKNKRTGIVIAAILIGGFLFFTSQNNSPKNSGRTSDTRTNSKSEGKMVAGYSGKVLAGSTSPYLIFTKADYMKAKSSGKIVFLDFYANWCPVCREEAPALTSGFDSLTTDKVIGFRVNWNDGDTDADEKALASEYGIAQQHTKVILKNGKEVSRTLESWTKDEFLTQMNTLGVQ